MRDLPIYELEEELVKGWSGTRRLLLQAPTGSGKSTQIPQIMLDRGLLGEGQVIILQPRRLAVRLLAARVAFERKVPLGSEVGYQIRLDHVAGPKTRIKYVTEGILLRQMLEDAELQGVSALLFDEFHERHLYGDVTLARALELQQKVRPDLFIGVMSATLNFGPLEQYLRPCQVLTSQGRTHPVQIEYLAKVPSEDEPIGEVAAKHFERWATLFPEGDVLIFMPGAYEIQRTIQSIQNTSASKGVIVLPLHGELSATDQDAAVRRYDRRKVIVATNVAETSLTIEGVRLVIDSGLARVSRYDPHRGINTLWVEKISRASADQRAGRAGRTAPGGCVRLWTERDHVTRAREELPEVKRLELSEVVLTLKASGVEDLRAFRWLEPPEEVFLDRAERLLRDLGALDYETGKITPLGRRMVSFPVHPRYSRMLLAAHEFKCVRPVALIAALTQGRSLWIRNSGAKIEEARRDLLGEEADSDFFMLMRAWNYAQRCRYDLNLCKRLGIHAQTARQVESLFEAFLEIAKREGLELTASPPSNDRLQKCLLLGFADHLAKRCDGGSLRCELIHGRSGQLERDSVVRSQSLLVAAEVHEIESKEGKLQVVLSLNTGVQKEWLQELFPGEFRMVDEVVYDTVRRRVVALKKGVFRDLELEVTLSDQPPLERAASVLAECVMRGDCPLKGWDDSIEQWIMRVNFLGSCFPEWEIPKIGEEERRLVIEQICWGATSYKEIKEKPVAPVVRSLLSSAQQEGVEKWAPERLELPGGRKAKITYSANGMPVLSARIQDLYGVEGELRVAQGRARLVIQILAPNFRPVQITQNLTHFWRETYPQVKQELKRKYPKHEWR